MSRAASTTELAVLIESGFAVIASRTLFVMLPPLEARKRRYPGAPDPNDVHSGREVRGQPVTGEPRDVREPAVLLGHLRAERPAAARNRLRTQAASSPSAKPERHGLEPNRPTTVERDEEEHAEVVPQQPIDRRVVEEVTEVVEDPVADAVEDVRRVAGHERRARVAERVCAKRTARSLRDFVRTGGCVALREGV